MSGWNNNYNNNSSSGDNDDNSGNNNSSSSFSPDSVQLPSSSATASSPQDNMTELERYFLGDRTPSTDSRATPVVDFIIQPGLTATAASSDDAGISSSTTTPTGILDQLLDRAASSVPSRDYPVGTRGGNTSGDRSRNNDGYSRER